MCLVNELSVKVKNMPPRSPYRRNTREPMKPRLSRKIINSARVNLNNHWSKFEATSKPSLMDFEIAQLLNNKIATSETEITDNLINELLELGSK